MECGACLSGEPTSIDIPLSLHPPTPSTNFPIVLPQIAVQLPSLGHLLVLSGPRLTPRSDQFRTSCLGRSVPLVVAKGMGWGLKDSSGLSVTSRPVVRMGSGLAFRRGLRSVLWSLQWPVTVHPLNNREYEGQREKRKHPGYKCLRPLPPEGSSPCGVSLGRKDQAQGRPALREEV